MTTHYLTDMAITGTSDRSLVRSWSEARQDVSFFSHAVFVYETIQEFFTTPPVYFAIPTNIMADAQQVEETLRQKFAWLAEQWKSETLVESSVERTISHPAYRRIIGMGSPAVQFILEDLRRGSDLWFWALTSITGESPEPADSKGDIDMMTRAWLDWGRRHHIVG